MQKVIRERPLKGVPRFSAPMRPVATPLGEWAIGSPRKRIADKSEVATSKAPSLVSRWAFGAAQIKMRRLSCRKKDI
jgi:hypothetical protein